jgi:hypothetical protein
MSELPQPLPDDVQDLIGRLDSIAQLEILLLLKNAAPQAWTAAQLASELRIDAASAAEQVAQLRERSLLVESPPGSGSYRFDAATPATGKAVENLAACYADRRVAVVTLLHSRPSESVRAFAEAFRIRKGDADG